MDVCTPDFTNTVMYASVLPAAAMAALVSGIIFILVYFLSIVTSNPKLSVWVKTEVIQVFISLSSVFILISLMTAFCTIDFNSVRTMFSGAPASAAAPLSTCPPVASSNVFSAAESYLCNAASYSHNTLNVVRYFASAYNILVYRSEYNCDIAEYVLMCIFGFSGTIHSSFAEYGGKLSVMSMLMGSSILYFLSALNSLFILLFAYRGFILFFLPMAIVIRSLPYMRSLGSLMISVCLAFFLIYPLLLALLSLVVSSAGIMTDSGGLIAEYANSEGGKFYEVSGASEFVYGSVLGAFSSSRYTSNPMLFEDFFEGGNDDVMGVLNLFARSFVVALFIPAIALGGAIASVRFFARIYGEDIDLSRLAQMV